MTTFIAASDRVRGVAARARALSFGRELAGRRHHRGLEPREGRRYRARRPGRHDSGRGIAESRSAVLGVGRARASRSDVPACHGQVTSRDRLTAEGKGRWPAGAAPRLASDVAARPYVLAHLFPGSDWCARGAAGRQTPACSGQRRMRPYCRIIDVPTHSCDTDAAMRYRGLATAVVLIVWVAFGPVTMALGGCAAMGATCEGPCGISFCAATPPRSQKPLESTVYLTTLPADPYSAQALQVLEHPPKPPSLSS
jgi:hypothetical protein